MKIWTLRIGMVIAIAILLLSFVNASWLAPTPGGGLKLVAHRGVYPQYDRAGLDDADCAAARIRTPQHSFIENTMPSINQAIAHRAHMVEIDLARTADDQLVLFHDATLECRTNGTGAIADHPLDELRGLDLGHGYTADDGASYPMRGGGINQLVTVDELLRTNRYTPLLFRFGTDDAREADLLHQALERAGTEIDDRYGFFGPPGPVERMRELAPGAWTFTRNEVARCTNDYLLYGWTSFVPASCENGTIAIPLNYQWFMWGWPNRLIARMEGVGAHIIVIGPHHSDSPDIGITEAQQLTSIPASFNGYVLIEDIWNIGPALRG